MRKIKWGDPRLPARFWAKTKINEESDCWEWTAGCDRDGYAIFRPTGQPSRRAHRHAYTVLVGPIGEETLNHDCHVRRCVNPNRGHATTPMSSVDNVREGKARVTHCPQGHEYTTENTIMVGPKKDRRGCRTCYNDRSRRYWHEVRKPRLAARRAAAEADWLAATIAE